MNKILTFNDFILDWFQDKEFAKYVLNHKDNFKNLISGLKNAYAFYLNGYNMFNYVNNPATAIIN